MVVDFVELFHAPLPSWSSVKALCACRMDDDAVLLLASLDGIQSPCTPRRYSDTVSASRRYSDTVSGFRSILSDEGRRVADAAATAGPPMASKATKVSAAVISGRR